MSDINSTKTRDELINEKVLAEASYDWTKVAELEAAIKEFDEKGKEHQAEMGKATTKATQEKTMKMEDLKNMLQGTPEIKEKNAETIVNQTKERLQTTIDKYKNLKTMSEDEKKKLTEEIKKTKEEYESAKNYFLGEIDYKPEELKKISTRRIRGLKKEVQWGIISYKLGEILQMATIKRRITENKLIKKFNEIWDNPINGIRFIMGFNKSRFLRYTGTKISGAMDKIGTDIGLQMDPQQFHKKFNTGKSNIFGILDTWEKTPEEQKIINAIKARINYYGYAYARKRATEWTNPFIDAEKNAQKEAKIIPMNTTKQSKAAA